VQLRAAWSAVNHSRAPSALLRVVREGKVEEAVRLAGGASSALAPLLALGEPAVATVECLVADAEGPSVAARGFETECAGLFLLLRTIQDARLPWVVRETNYPPVATDPFRSMLLALGRRWAGPIAGDDPGLPLFVGLETLAAADQLAVWKQVGAGDDRRFRRALFALLVDQRLAADERAWREPAALAAVAEGRVGRKGADRTLDLTAIALLRLWSRWLRHFAGSSAPYLLRTFIRRPGWILVDDETIVVEPAPKELDVVLELAGYFDPLERVPWLGDRRVRFER
jgi:hypothetical protein